MVNTNVAQYLKVRKAGGGGFDRMVKYGFKGMRKATSAAPRLQWETPNDQAMREMVDDLKRYATGPERQAAIRKIFENQEHVFSTLTADDLDWIVSRAIETGDYNYQRAEDALRLKIRGDEYLRNYHQTITPNPRLEKCNSSRLHELLQYTNEFEAFRNARVFLLQHDWSAAFSDETLSELVDGEVHLPADFCAFEFQISGTRAIALVPPDIGQTAIAVKWRNENEWTPLPVYREILEGKSYDTVSKSHALDLIKKTLQLETTRQWINMLMTQVRCALVALDAQVIETELVRAPHKPNMKRIKGGKLPIFDYHVLSLANRNRAAPLPSDEPHGTHASPRLHFRRGHWRHYENHKTWINWTLVGDPDLGFVDKDYRL